jgi:hypothetical protein
MNDSFDTPAATIRLERDAPGPQPEAPDAPATNQGPATGTRFDTCRWAKLAVNGTPPHCTHPEVLPYAGQHGFSAESWCPECGLYKLKRKARQG